MLGRRKKVATLSDVKPDLPRAVEHLWFWFLEISLGLDCGGGGYPSVTWQGIDAWARLTGRAIAPWEAMVLVRLGSLRVSIAAEASRRDMQRLKT